MTRGRGRPRINEERSTHTLGVRVTTEQLSILRQYAKDRSISISTAVRVRLQDIFLLDKTKG